MARRWLFCVAWIPAIIPNVFGFGEVIWKTAGFTFTRERLAPTWAMLGWLIFTLGAMINLRSVHRNSRQPLLRNRLNYWTPAFLLIILNDVLIFVGSPIPGNPVRLAATALGAFIIVTHDPPDLRQVAQRVFTYIITTTGDCGVLSDWLHGFTNCLQSAAELQSDFRRGRHCAGAFFDIYASAFRGAAMGQSLVQHSGISSQQNVACLQRTDQ